VGRGEVRWWLRTDFSKQVKRGVSVYFSDLEEMGASIFGRMDEELVR
jgi:hypothetical protein